MKIIITERQYFKILKEESEDESILLVGDSHTVDVGWTWSSLMKKEKKNVKVIAIGGKRTSWMKEQLADELSSKHYNKVVIWGGNNDTFSLVSNDKAIKNIQDMVDMVNKQGGTAYVVQGYNYEIFADENKYKPTKYADISDMKKYRKKYIQFQKDLGNSITGAIIIPMFEIDNSYTSDNVHGNQAAHKKVFREILSYVEGKSGQKVERAVKEKENTQDVLDRINKIKNDGQELKAYKGTSIPYDALVEALQIGLQFLGFSLPKWGVDGRFGPETKRAVLNFQEKHGFEKNGIVGSSEVTTLIDELNKNDFLHADLDKIEREKTEKVKDVVLGDTLKIENPGIDVRSYPSDLVDRFKNTVGEKDYDEFISGCKSIGLDPMIAIRQLYSESGFDKNVISCKRKSSAGAMGIAQFMPGTWKHYGEGGDVCNPSDALKAYIRLMKDHLEMFPGRPDLAVAGYNSGPGYKAYKNALKNNLDFTTLKDIIPNETYRYTSTIFQA